MRVGFTASVIGHALLLAWGLFQLPSAKPFEVAEAVDALPVDLVPVADVSRIAEGSKTAPLGDTASQAKVETPAPRPDSTRVGNAPTDQKTPVTEKTTQTAAAPEAATPPPAPPPPAPKPPEPVPPDPKPPAPAPPPEPDPAPAPPEPAPAPEKPVEAPPPTADVGEIKAEPDKPVEDPAPAPAPAIKPTAKPRPPQPTQVATAADAPATAPERKPDQRKPADKASDRPEKKADKEFDPNQMAALLNKIDPSGGGAKASNRPASLGSPDKTGPVARMTQNELDALRAKIQNCWSPPIGADGADAMIVPVRIELNPDGSLAGEPVAKQIPPGPFGRVMAEAALRAVRRCAPYNDVLPAEKYESWQVVNINFDPRAMF